MQINPIYSAILSGNNFKCYNPGVKSLVSCLSDENVQRRAMMLIMGIVDIENEKNSLNEVVLGTARGSKKKIVLTLVDYNYLFGIVTYEYGETKTRYFKTQEEADDYALNGSEYCGYYESSDEHSFMACHTFIRQDTTDIDVWNKYLPVDEANL